MNLTPQFAKFPWEQQRDFISSIAINQVTSVPSAEPFPVSLFREEVQPILALIAGLLGVGGLGEISRACVYFLQLMSQIGVVLDIPGFLAANIQTQFQELSNTGHFRFSSMVFYLFLYQHADKFEGLGLDRVYDLNSQPRPVFA